MYALDEKEALEAMGSFLQAWYKLGHSDDSALAPVLSEIEILKDGDTAGPAASYRWLAAVRKVVARRGGGAVTTLDEREALEAMSNFLDAWYKLGHVDDSDLVAVLSEIEIMEDGGTGDPAAWRDWLDSVEKVVAKRGSGSGQFG